MSEAAPVHFEHERLGPIEAPSAALLHCNGLPGFPEARSLLIVEHDRPSDFAWLLCLEIPGFALPVTDPNRFYPEYRPTPHLADLRVIEAGPEDEIDWLVVANASGSEVVLNLAAPILVNRAAGRLVQAILGGDGWPVRAPLAPKRDDALPQTESKPQR